MINHYCKEEFVPAYICLAVLVLILGEAIDITLQRDCSIKTEPERGLRFNTLTLYDWRRSLDPVHDPYFVSQDTTEHTLIPFCSILLDAIYQFIIAHDGQVIIQYRIINTDQVQVQPFTSFSEKFNALNLSMPSVRPLSLTRLTSRHFRFAPGMYKLLDTCAHNLGEPRPENTFLMGVYHNSTANMTSFDATIKNFIRLTLSQNNINEKTIYDEVQVLGSLVGMFFLLCAAVPICDGLKNYLHRKFRGDRPPERDSLLPRPGRESH